MSDTTKGLYRKFRIERTDGKSAEGEKHQNCDYFVLDLTHDKHAMPAIKAYIESCRREYPKLAQSLRNLLARLREEEFVIATHKQQQARALLENK